MTAANSCMWRCGGWLMTGAVLLCTFGCGSEGDPCSVKGQVTFSGTAIEEGNIRFLTQGETPGPGGSAKINNGSYEIPKDAGMCAGSYFVSITATRAPTAAEAAAMSRGDEDEDEDEERASVDPSERRVQYLPQKYSQGQELKADLAPGENTQDFDLK